MGFQIINISYHLELSGQVTNQFAGAFSAGPPQTIICGTYVHLEAIVDGDIFPDHQTLWEQLSGTPVIWIGNQDNTLTTSYEQTSVRTDSVFRFWIDKGTENELFHDVTIYGTIKDEISLSFATTNSIINDYSANTILANSVFGIPAPAAVDVGNAGIGFENDSRTWVYWVFTTQPTSTLKYVDVEENAQGIWIVKERIYPTEPQVYISGNATATYRINAVYENGGITQEFTGAPARLSIQNNVQVIDRLFGATSQPLPELTATFTTRTKIAYESEPDQVSLSFTGEPTANLNVTYTNRTKIIYAIDESFTLAFNVAPMLDTMITTVTLRTRGSIGG